MRAAVVIPTWNARDLLADALESIQAQTVPVEIVVVDNASTDGTAEMLATDFPDVTVVRNPSNLGFGRAVNRGAREVADADVIVLVNNDAVCEPDFVERLLEPLADERVGMVAGVLLQGSAPGLIDSAGIELDTTLQSWDKLWNRPVEELTEAAEPVGPCGGAAAYRMKAFADLGGFDEQFFAYWEDVDLALRFRLAGWNCALAPAARALHRHGSTLGGVSPTQQRLAAYGRAYMLAKYRVARAGLLMRLKIAALDWPPLMIHLLFRRDLGLLRARAAGRQDGLLAPPLRAPLELASIRFGEAASRQMTFHRLRLGGSLPDYYRDRTPPAAGTSG